jgi:hypothetical protein
MPESRPVTHEDPLAGLDDVPWAELRGSHGWATDVPDDLRALLKPGDRFGVWRMCVFHQGTRYQATAHAVPFLARLALHPDVPQRAEIVDFLVALAVGFDDEHLPHGYDIAELRAAVPEVESFYRERYPDDPDKVTDWMGCDPTLNYVAAHESVRVAARELHAGLDDPDERLRAAVACLLGWFPDDADLHVPVLLDLVGAEASADVAANAVVSLGLLARGLSAASVFEAVVRELRIRLDGEESLLRWAAAVALARAGHCDMPVVTALAAACATPPPQSGAGIFFMRGNVTGLAVQSLAAFAEEVPDSAFADVLLGLSRGHETEGYAESPTARAVLTLAFGPRDRLPRPPFADLTLRQQQVVTVLAEFDYHPHRATGFWSAISGWGLPRDVAALKAYRVGVGRADAGPRHPNIWG